MKYFAKAKCEIKSTHREPRFHPNAVRISHCEAIFHPPVRADLVKKKTLSLDKVFFYGLPARRFQTERAAFSAAQKTRQPTP